MEEKEARKARLEVSRGLEHEREGQEFQGRGREVSKHRSLAGRTQVQKKDTHTHARTRAEGSSVGSAHRLSIHCN